jgi:hypothetical protein
VTGLPESLTHAVGRLPCPLSGFTPVTAQGVISGIGVLAVARVVLTRENQAMYTSRKSGSLHREETRTDEY